MDWVLECRDPVGVEDAVDGLALIPKIQCVRELTARESSISNVVRDTELQDV